MFLKGPSRCASSNIYCISTVNTQHMQGSDVLLQLGYTWRLHNVSSFNVNNGIPLENNLTVP